MVGFEQPVGRLAAERRSVAAAGRRGFAGDRVDAAAARRLVVVGVDGLGEPAADPEVGERPLVEDDKIGIAPGFCETPADLGGAIGAVATGGPQLAAGSRALSAAEGMSASTPRRAWRQPAPRATTTRPSSSRLTAITASLDTVAPSSRTAMAKPR